MDVQRRATRQREEETTGDFLQEVTFHLSYSGPTDVNSAPTNWCITDFTQHNIATFC